MTDKRLPEEDLLRERRYRPNHDDGWQRPPVHRAPQLPPRAQLQNHEEHLNHRDFPDQAPNFPVHNIPYRPNLPDHGHHVDNYDVHYHEPHQPYHLQPDHRLPTAGNYPSTPISLISADHYATHFLLLVPPSSHLLSTLLADAKKARVTTSHIPAEDVVERALENRTLTHISNGPSGGIWVVAAEKPDVVACLLAEMQGGWELLGVGKGGNEGMTFLRHPCGFGTEQEVEKKKEKTQKDYKTESADVEKNRRNKERGGDEGRAWEREEDSDEGDVVLRGHHRVRVQDADRGQDRERGQAAKRGQERELDRDRNIHRGQEAWRKRPRNRDPGELIPAANTNRDFEDRFRRLELEGRQGRRG